MAVVVTLLVVGVILLMLETILPGLVAGLVGFGCLVAGVLLSYSQFGPGTGSLVLVIVLFVLLAGVAFWVKFFPDSPMAKRFVSVGTTGEIRAERPDLLHQKGTAYTQLRPSGTALINGQRVDVVSEGALIPRGTPVKVVAIEGMRVVVRAMPGEASSSENKPLKP